MEQARSTLVLAAGYGTLAQAHQDFDALDRLCEEDGDFDYLDGALVDSSDEARPRVVRVLHPPRRKGAAARLEGAAGRVALYVFHGLALTGGPAGGEVMTTDASGTARTPIDPEDVSKLRAVRKRASAELVVIFAPRLADRIGAAVTATDRYVSKDVHATPDELMAQFRQESETSAGR